MFPSLSWPEAVVQLYPSASAQQRLSLSWPEAVVNLHPLDLDIVVINVSVPLLGCNANATAVHVWATPGQRPRSTCGMQRYAVPWPDPGRYVPGQKPCAQHLARGRAPSSNQPPIPGQRPCPRRVWRCRRSPLKTLKPGILAGGGAVQVWATPGQMPCANCGIKKRPTLARSRCVASEPEAAAPRSVF